MGSSGLTMPPARAVPGGRPPAGGRRCGAVRQEAEHRDGRSHGVGGVLSGGFSLDQDPGPQFGGVGRGEPDGAVPVVIRDGHRSAQRRQVGDGGQRHLGRAHVRGGVAQRGPAAQPHRCRRQRRVTAGAYGAVGDLLPQCRDPAPTEGVVVVRVVDVRVAVVVPGHPHQGHVQPDRLVVLVQRVDDEPETLTVGGGPEERVLGVAGRTAGLVQGRCDRRTDLHPPEGEVVRVGIGAHALTDHQELALVEPRDGGRPGLHAPFGHLDQRRLVAERVQIAGVDHAHVLVAAQRGFVVPGQDRLHTGRAVRTYVPLAVQVEPRSEPRQPQGVRGYRLRADHRRRSGGRVPEQPGLGALTDQHVAVRTVERHAERIVRGVPRQVRLLLPVVGHPVPVPCPHGADDPAPEVVLVGHDGSVGPRCADGQSAVPEFDVVGRIEGCDGAEGVGP